MYATLSKTVELGRYNKVKITFKVTHSLSSLISLFNTSRDFLEVFHSSDSSTYLHRFTHSHFHLNFHAIHRFILSYLQLVSLLCWMQFVNRYQSLVQSDWFETDSNSPQPAPVAGVAVWCCSPPQGPTDSWRNDDIITIYRHTRHAIFSTHLLPNTFHQQQYISHKRTYSTACSNMISRQHVVPVQYISAMLFSFICMHYEHNNKGKEKERKSIYIAPFCTKVHTKRSGMDHTVLPANNTMPAFLSSAFTRCHHHSNWGSRHPTAAHYSFIDPERMKGWVGLVGWPTADGLPA